MTVSKIIESDFVKDDTEIFIRRDFDIRAHGNWYQDNVLNYHEHEVESFTWQDDKKVYIDVK